MAKMLNQLAENRENREQNRANTCAAQKETRPKLAKVSRRSGGDLAIRWIRQQTINCRAIRKIQKMRKIQVSEHSNWQLPIASISRQ